MAIMNGILGNVVNYGSPDYQRNVSLAEQQEILKRERLMREGYRPNAAERDVALQAFAEKNKLPENYSPNPSHMGALGEFIENNPTIAHTAGTGINKGANALYDHVLKPTYKHGYDLTADGLLGAGNLGRGVLGMPEDTEVGFRYRNLPAPAEQVSSPFKQEYSDSLSQVGDGALTQYALDANTLPERNIDTGELEQLGEAPYAQLLPDAQDGALTPEAVTDGALTTEPVTQVANSETEGVLASDAVKTSGKQDVLKQIGEAASVDRSGTATGNKRDAASLSVARNKIGLSEMLIRAGGAITGASGDGALAAINAGTAAYGGIQDENRRLEQVQYENDQKAYEAEENRKIQRMQATGQSSAAMKAAIEKSDAQVARNFRIQTLDTLINDLTAAGDNVTGPLDGTVINLLDRARGAPEANLRLRLEDQRVNAALTKVEQTKGAISNREMELFLSPMPKLTDSEEVWIDWMTMQRNIAAKMSNIAAGGVGADGRYINAVAPDAELDSVLAAYLEKYPQQK